MIITGAMSEALLNAGRQTLMLELQEASRLPNVWAMILFAPPISSCTVKAKWWFRELANRATLVRKSPQRLPVPALRLFVHPAEALHGDLGMIESRDVMLFISLLRWRMKELDLIIPRLEDKSIALLAMTGKPTSPLGLAAKRCWISP